MYDSSTDTLKHILMVQQFLTLFINDLSRRGINHDASKLESPEKETFDEFTPKLRGSTYGSDEYAQFLKDMNVALEHHYDVNSHHPEHFKKGIRGMTLFDIVEMFCDWGAATYRHDDGNIFKSIELNQKRFGYSDEIKDLLWNTAKAIKSSAGYFLTHSEIGIEKKD